MEIVGIAGGSGTGKTTACEQLVDIYPEIYELISLDNYQQLDKHAPGFPMVNGMPNWDHPDVIAWDKLRRDIIALKSGQAATALVWRHRSNPDFHIHKQLKEIILKPKPVIIVEGHLALNYRLFDLYDQTIYLDVDEATRNQRRIDARAGKGFIGTTGAYMTQILEPMHKQYVEPTKDVADVVIDTHITIAETADAIRHLVRQAQAT